jgi:hypothetical protein
MSSACSLALSSLNLTLEQIMAVTTGLEKTFITTRRHGSVSTEAAIGMKRYESRFPASLSFVQSPPQHAALLGRLMEHDNIISRIIGYCIREDDLFFGRYVDSCESLRVLCTNYLTVAGNGPTR